MATSQRSGLRYADLPAIEAAQLPGNPAATRALEQIRQTLGMRFGQGGQMVDRAVTWGDLVENGIVTMRGADGKPILIKNPAAPSSPARRRWWTASRRRRRASRPRRAWALWCWRGQAEFRLLRLRRDFPGHDEQPGAGRQRGPDDGWVYADPVGGNGGVTFFYWVRFVSVGGKLGPFNGVGGTTGAVSLDPAYLIDVLAPPATRRRCSTR